MKTRRGFTGICLILVVASLLGGCGGDRALREGKILLAEGKVEKGLEELEKATREDPDNREIRAFYLRQKEAAVARILAEGDSARVGEQFDIAENQFQRALQLDPGNQKAQAGLTQVRQGRRHKALLAEAEQAFNQGNIDEADAKLRRILRENPQQRGANALKRLIDEKSLAGRTMPPSLKLAMDKPISLDFRDANLKSVLEVISRTAGINFLFDRDVRSDLRTSIFVKNTSIENAVKFILSTSQLAYKVLNENSLLIYPNVPVKAKEYQDLVVRGFYLANADARQTLNMIKSVVKTRDVFIDEKLGLLIMQDTPDAVRLAERLIAMQDLAEPEVMLELEVLEMGHKRLVDMGLTPPTEIDLMAPGYTQPSDTGTATSTLTLGQLRHTTARNLMVTNAITTSAKLHMENGDTNILANPRIRVKSREKAKIHIGERVPVITTTIAAAGNTSFLPESVNYLDVGIKLEVEPSVHLTDEVGMRVMLEVSSLGQKTTTKNGSEVYRVGTRNTSTVLRLRDGETQVLAGLISDEERQSVVGLPGLGDIPALGRLFSAKSDSKDKTEIVLLITPHIVRTLNRPDAVQTEFISGPEAAVGSGPLVLRSFGGGQPAQPQNVAPPVSEQPEPAASAPLPAAETETVEEEVPAPEDNRAGGR